MPEIVAGLTASPDSEVFQANLVKLQQYLRSRAYNSQTLMPRFPLQFLLLIARVC